jgi:glycosyltransferase involved in cell wall biosynthesis
MRDRGSEGQDRSGQCHQAVHAADPGAGTHQSAGRVSVIVPAYNAAATIERTISSVLNQTYVDLEVLAVDDGSTDETAALVQRFANVDCRIRLLQKPNGGLVSARNHGIAHANGEFIAPIDADDLWHPEKIRKQVALMRDRGARVGLIYTWARGIDEQDRVIFDITPCGFRGDVYAALIMRNFVGSGAPLVRRHCVEEVGGYDGTLAARGAPCTEDLKFNLDIAERYHFDFVPEFLWGYRFRDSSMSTDIEAMLRSHAVVVRDVRERHPELPETLFRWARGHQHREWGLTHLSKGHLLEGVRLLLAAARDDPLVTLQVGFRRMCSRLWRPSSLSKLFTPAIHGSAQAGVVGRNFLEVDPTVFCERPKSIWTRRRLAYIAELSVQSRNERGGSARQLT